MEAWQEELLHVLPTTQCEHRLFALLASQASHLGFDWCAYGLRLPLPLTRPKTSLLNNYPIAWQQRYQEKQYIIIDPTVRHGMQSLAPFLWSEALCSAEPAFCEEARTFGLAIGWAQACRSIHGTGGMLTLARAAEPLSAVELREKEPWMIWLAQTAHAGMTRLLSDKLMPEAGVQLSRREAEVLRWTGDGKTSSEIADLLHLSERTVNFHIGNAMTKLHTANKTAAVVMAAVLGLL